MPSLLDQYSEALRTVEITVQSPRGWVTVHRSRSGEVSTQLRPGALSRLTEPELAAELRETLTAATREYQRRCREIRRDIFGTDAVGGVPEEHG